MSFGKWKRGMGRFVEMLNYDILSSLLPSRLLEYVQHRVLKMKYFSCDSPKLPGYGREILHEICHCHTRSLLDCIRSLNQVMI